MAEAAMSLHRVRDRDEFAAAQFHETVYADLRRIAQRHLRGRRRRDNVTRTPR